MLVAFYYDCRYAEIWTSHLLLQPYPYSHITLAVGIDSTCGRTQTLQTRPVLQYLDLILTKEERMVSGIEVGVNQEGVRFL